MIARRRSPEPEPLSKQVKSRLTRVAKSVGHTTDRVLGDQVISTGSTLLDLAISSGRYPEGGIPGGILVEIFGPSGCGKTVLLCELAGGVQRLGGDVMFRDPEGRLNAQFAAIFGFRVENADYKRPDTVPELFAPIRKWRPAHKGINGIFADSLAALSTDLEMKKGDKMGQRRAKEFSEGCRTTCRDLARRGFLMVCSNQVRQNVDAGPFAEKFTTPGGLSIGFYSSLRLRCYSPIKITRELPSAKGQKIDDPDDGDGEEESDEKKSDKSVNKRVVGVKTTVEVYKSSIDVPYRKAPVYILYDYGIDDIRANLEFVKSTVGTSSYVLGEGEKLGNGLERSIRMVEEGELESQLKKYAIQLWRETEEKFRVQRQPKRR